LGELELAVAAEILVPIAASDLVVTLHAADHQQLLEELRRLREGIERTGPQPTGDQDVASPLRSRPDQRRGLHLQESLTLQRSAHRGDAPGSSDQICRHAGPAKIQVSPLEPARLVDVGPILNLERQWIRRAQHRHLRSRHLDLTGGHVGIGGAFGTGAHCPGDGHAVLITEILGDLTGSRVGLGVDDHLGHTRGIANQQEVDPAEVSPGCHPSGQPDLAPVVGYP